MSLVADIFGETGGVVIRVDAELKIEEPKPNIFPVTDSAGLVETGSGFGPPKPKKPPDSFLTFCVVGGADLAEGLNVCEGWGFDCWGTDGEICDFDTSCGGDSFSFPVDNVTGSCLCERCLG